MSRTLLRRLRAMLPVLAAPATPASAPPLAQALQEIAERVLREPDRAPPAPPAPAPAPGPSLLWPLLHSLGRGLRRIVVHPGRLALVYGGLRLFGDRDTLRQLDAVEQRLLIGWQRLLQHGVAGAALR